MPAWRLCDNMAYFVESTTNFIISDIEKNKYAEISQVDLNECQKLGKKYFCTGISIFNLEHNNCVGKILDQENSEILDFCKEKALKLEKSTMLIQKVDANSVLFVSMNDTSAKIRVGDETRKVVIPKVGLLIAKSNRILKTNYGRSRDNIK